MIDLQKNSEAVLASLLKQATFNLPESDSERTTQWFDRPAGVAGSPVHSGDSRHRERGRNHDDLVQTRLLQFERADVR